MLRDHFTGNNHEHISNGIDRKSTVLSRILAERRREDGVENERRVSYSDFGAEEGGAEVSYFERFSQSTTQY